MKRRRQLVFTLSLGLLWLLAALLLQASGALAALNVETRTFGSVRVTADDFVELGGGRVQASGHIVLGATGAPADHFQLTGASDYVIATGTLVTGTGTLAFNTGPQPVFQGNFSLDGAAAQPAIGPASPVWLLTALGDFALQGAPAVTSIDLSSGHISGRAAVRVSPPGLDRVVWASFGLSPGGAVSGQLDPFELTVAGTRVSVTNAQLSNTAIQAPAATLIAAETYGGGQQAISGFTLKPQALELGGAAGASFALPNVVFGSGQVISLTHITAQLTVQNGVYIFQAQGTLHVALAGNHLTATAGFSVDSHGDVAGDLPALTLTVAGFTLQLDEVVLDRTGLNIDTARLTLPTRFGGESVAVQEVSITRDGLSIGCGVINIPDLKFGDGSKFKITAVRLLLRVDQGVYTFEASGTLRFHLTHFDQDIPVEFAIDSAGDISATLGAFALALDDFTLNVGQAHLNNTGLTIASATLQLPNVLGQQLYVSVTDVAVTQDGLAIHSELDLPDFNFGDGHALRLQAIKVTLNSTAAGYVLAGSSTLMLKPFTDAISVPLQISLDTHGAFAGAVGEFSLPFFLGTLAVHGGTLDNTGVTVGSATWLLARWAGGAQVGLPGITFDRDGFKINGGVSFDIPALALGRYASLTGGHGTIGVQNGLYSLVVSSTLNVTLPDNVQTLAFEFEADTAGDIRGSINLDLNLAGCQLHIVNMGLSHTSADLVFSVASASLTLPAWTHLPVLTVSDVQLDANGLTTQGGSFLVSVPEFTLFDTAPAKLTFKSSALILAVDRQQDQTRYVFTWYTRLLLEVPRGEPTTLVDPKIVLDNGHLRAEVDKFALWFADCTLSIPSAQLDENGLTIPVATLELPYWAKYRAITVQNLIIDRNGLQVETDFPLPDINLGGVVIFRNLQAGFGVDSVHGWEVFIKIKGTLALRIGKLIKLDVDLSQAQIGTSGAFSGIVNSLLLQIRTNWQLSLSNVQFDNTHLYVGTGTLIAPGGIHCTVQQVQIDGKSPYIHFNGGEACGLPKEEVLADDGEFVLAVQPLELALTTQVSRTVDITVTGINTATDAVSLDLINPPIGLVYAFDSTLVQPGQSTRLTLTDTALLMNGEYALHLTGVDISDTQTTTVRLHVDKPQFQVQAAPPAQVIRPGATAIYTVQVSAAHWTPPVRVSGDDLRHLPPGATAGFRLSPQAAPVEAITITAPLTVYWTVTLPPTATLGRFVLDVQAASDGQLRGDEVLLTVWKPAYEVWLPIGCRP